MCTTLRAALALFFAMLCGIPGAAAASPAAPSYAFAPVTQYNLKLTASYWNPILHYVSQRSGVRLNLKLGRTADDTTAFVLAGGVDFAFTNHLSDPDRVRLGWSVFARRNGAPVQAQIVVPADSKISSLAELAGARVVFPDPEAFLSYRLPYAELARQGVRVDTAFAGNMDAAFTQLFSGRARAAGVHSQLVQHYAGRENKAYRVLWRSASFKDLPLIASKRVPPQQLQAVADAFLGMAREPQGRRILADAAALLHAREPLSFVPAAADDYDDFRRFEHAAPADPR